MAIVVKAPAQRHFQTSHHPKGDYDRRQPPRKKKNWAQTESKAVARGKDSTFDRNQRNIRRADEGKKGSANRRRSP